MKRVFGGMPVIFALAAVTTGVLYSASAIEYALARTAPVWAEFVRPISWGVLALCAGALVRENWRDLASIFSAKWKFRCLAEDVEVLAELVADDNNYKSEAQGVIGPPLLPLETKIAAMKGALGSIGVDSPPTRESADWQGYLPLLRSWIAEGDLEGARRYHPRTTAIVGFDYY